MRRKLEPSPGRQALSLISAPDGRYTLHLCHNCRRRGSCMLTAVLQSCFVGILATTTGRMGDSACSLQSQKRCAPCEGEMKALEPQELSEAVRRLPLWSLSSDGKRINRAFVAKNFVEAMAFLNAVGEVAEREGHHPDLHLTSYRNVAVDLWTHAVAGITSNDIIMAEEIDKVKVMYSPKWLKEHPEAAHTAKQ